MAEIKPMGVKLNGKDTKIPALYLIEGGTEGTYVQARMLVDALGVGSVHGKGDYIEIVTQQPAAPAPKPLAGRRIAVSAPHSRNGNQSTIIKSYYEGNVMFDVAVELVAQLRALGATVLLVRDSLDQTLTLKQRTDMINAINPDLCIEIHSDANAAASVRGIHVIRQLARTGDKLAQLLLDEMHLATGLPKNSKGVWTRTLTSNPRFDWYHMLREVLCHSLIIEVGYHTNAADMALLSSPCAPKLIATGARNAILKFMK